jgi:HD-like signal output (HDOD) protein
MPITLDQLVANLAERPLPALAVTVQRVKQLLNNPNASNHDLQQVIGLDPGFTMELYRRFGIAAGDRRGPVSNIAHAISMLGPAPVKDAANSLPLLDKSLPDAAKSGIYHCYSRAIHASIYAQDIGAQREDKNPDEMGHAALLYNCAEMALWTYAGKAMQKIHGMVRKGADYGSASHSVLGFTLEQLSTKLSLVWYLSPLIKQTIDRAWHNQPRPMGVVLASSLARASALGWYSTEVDELIEFLADFRHQSREHTIAHIHSQAASIARSLPGLPLPVPVYNILQQRPRPVALTPATEPQAEKQAAAQGSIGVAAEKPKAPSKKVFTSPETAPQKKPVAEQAPAEVKKPVAPPPEKPASTPGLPPATKPRPTARDGEGVTRQARVTLPPEWKDPLSSFSRLLRGELGLQRIMFVMLTQDRKQASVVHLIGADTHSGLRRFSLKISGKNLFTILLSKQQGFWLKPANREKFLPLVPEHVVESIDKEGFFCMSLFVDEKPVGFIYADGKSAMNEENYTQFKQLCAGLCSDLEKTR